MANYRHTKNPFVCCGTCLNAQRKQVPTAFQFNDANKPLVGFRTQLTCGLTAQEVAPLRVCDAWRRKYAQFMIDLAIGAMVVGVVIAALLLLFL